MRQHHLAHRHMIESRPATLCAVGARHGWVQLLPQQREIRPFRDPLQVIDLCRQACSRSSTADNPGHRTIATSDHQPQQ